MIFDIFRFRNILLKSHNRFLFEEEGELLTKNLFEVDYMLEEIFNEILDSQDGDYIVIAQVLADMKPAGW